GDEELLVGVELAARELAVALRGELLVAAVFREAVEEHVLEILEHAGVGVNAFETDGDRTGGVETKHEREAALLAGGHGEHERGFTGDDQQAAVVAEFR